VTVLRPRFLTAGAACAAALAVALSPILAGAAVRDVAFTFLSFVVLAQAWNLIGGFGGQFSLGNSAFVGFGAYVTAWLLINFALSPLAAIAIAAVTVVPLALLLSFALFRLHGAYLSVGSLAVSLAVIAWMENWSVTGATQGLNIPFDRSLGDETVYVLTVAVVVAVTLAAWYLSRSDFGLCLQAVRDGELPAYCDAAYPLNFLAQRADGTCATSDADGRSIHDQFFGQSSLRTHAIVNARNVVRVRSALSLAALGPLGCGISTGAGAVLNALRVRQGASIAIFGTGAVGLSAVMAACIAGATTIVAVDIVPSRLELALELGATHAVDGVGRDVVAAVRDITRGGADYSLDCTGIPRVLRAAYAALRTRGRCGLIGAAAAGTMVDFDMMELLNGGRSIVGIIEGDSNPPLFIPQLLEHNAQGRFPFEKLIAYYPFANLADAVHDAESGRSVKPVLTFS
jgi:aryl-alcohol dehydrogenase